MTSAGAVAPPPLPFDVCGPLPTGVTLLEASAGTGKTFAIASLAARWVAQGTPLDRLLIVTFTRMASGELRERVRARLVTAADGLAAARCGSHAGDDPLVAFLASGSDDEVAVRQCRVDRAVADFDAATIDTTHGFCLHVLSGLGISGDVERDVTLVEDARDLLEEVVDDLYVKRFWSSGDTPPISRLDAIRIADRVLANPAAELLPPESKERSAPAMRRRLARAVIEEMDARKKAAGILTYDDLLTRLRDTLADPVRGEAACGRLRSRYDVALVDEFQDTDPVQWEIMRRAFGAGASTLVLIGDPKQAIYAFRGADVYAYLEAASQARSESTLATNWRSDQGLIDAFDALFEGALLGHEGIAYRTVCAAPPNSERRLLDAPHEAPLRFRLLRRSDVERTRDGFARTPAARSAIAADLAADVADLLASDATLVARRADGSEAGRERVRAGDLAVLVRTNRQAETVREALHAAGIPAVLGGAGSVFESVPATEWLRLLEALSQPTARDRAASAALTAFIGWTPEHAATAGDDEWEDLHWRLHRWAALLRNQGVAALLETLTVAEDLPARILTRPSGERFLTDLRHAGQLLHAAAMEESLGPTALTNWLRRRIRDAAKDADNEDRSRRLESDADAVQVLTVHRSKGLEFPIVYCPFLWDFWVPDSDLVVFHDPDNGYVRTIDVGGKPDEAGGSPWQHHHDIEEREQRGEDLRLLYVAVTRARHQVVVWWAGTKTTRNSPLCRLLLAKSTAGEIASRASRAPADEEVVELVSSLVAPSGGNVSVELVEPSSRPAASGAPDGRVAPLLLAAEFGRRFDAAWRRTSYSGITAAAHDGPRVGSEADDSLIEDDDPIVAGAEPAAGGDAAGGGDAGGAEQALPMPLLLGGMPGGTRVGTLVHRVLEMVDFAAEDLGRELRSHLEAELALRPLELGPVDEVTAGLETAIRSPLGPLVGGIALRDIERADRRDELAFELPLVGGDATAGELSVGDVAALLRHHLPAGDPLSAYADRLEDETLAGARRGYLTGSIDLVFRTADGRYFVVDYKTNRLGGRDEQLTTADYRAEALTAEMHRAHYPLQALLYLVALHRYLRWRVRGYDASRQLGGALYLFLRGMSAAAGAPNGAAPCGVWWWQPPLGAVEAVSDLLDRGRTAA